MAHLSVMHTKCTYGVCACLLLTVFSLAQCCDFQGMVAAAAWPFPISVQSRSIALNEKV